MSLENKATSTPQRYSTLVWLALLLIMAGGAWARWRYIEAGVFHIDEFISMLAIQMILEKGQPVLPSGLYYDHGLVYAYAGALAASLAGGDVLAARWWSLIAGVLSIGLIYLAYGRLFKASGWGLMAALGMAGYSEIIQWGGRVRMYSQANLFLLSWILLAWLGTFGGGHRWARWALLLSLCLGIYTHLSLWLALPPLILALILVWAISNQGKLKWSRLSPAIALEAVVAVLLIGLMGLNSQNSFQASYRLDTISVTEAANENPIADIVRPTFDIERWVEMGNYLTGSELLPFSLLGLVAIARATLALLRRRLAPADLAALFVAAILAGILGELLLFVAEKWQLSRYNYILIFPMLLLLAPYGLQTVADQVVWLLQRVRPDSEGAAVYSRGIVLIILGLVWPLSQLWPEASQAMKGDTNTPNQLNLAFEWIEPLRAPEDQLMTTQPAAGYLFSKPLAYYANHSLPLIIPGPDDRWLDGYTGATYLENVASLKQALKAPGRLWFVSDEEHLYKDLEPIFAQTLLTQMELMRAFGNIVILRERLDLPLPPETPMYPLGFTVGSNLVLVGYSVAEPLLPGQQAPLSLYVENTRPLWPYKIFVHLQDPHGNIVAQADFKPLDQFDEKLRGRLPAEAGSDRVILTTVLALPADLAPGQYSLVAGLYDPVTQQNLPIPNDPSGENALPLGQLEVSAPIF